MALSFFTVMVFLSFCMADTKATAPRSDPLSCCRKASSRTASCPRLGSPLKVCGQGQLSADYMSVSDDTLASRVMAQVLVQHTKGTYRTGGLQRGAARRRGSAGDGKEKAYSGGQVVVHQVQSLLQQLDTCCVRAVVDKGQQTARTCLYMSHEANTWPYSHDTTQKDRTPDLSGRRDRSPPQW